MTKQTSTTMNTTVTTMNTVHTLAKEAVFALRASDKQAGSAQQKVFVALCKAHEAGFKSIEQYCIREHEQSAAITLLNSIFSDVFEIMEQGEGGKFVPVNGYEKKDIRNMKATLNKVRWAVGRMIKTGHYMEGEGYKETMTGGKNPKPKGEYKVLGELFHSPKELEADADLASEYVSLTGSMAKFNGVCRERLGIKTATKAPNHGEASPTNTPIGAAKFLSSLLAKVRVDQTQFSDEIEDELIGLLSALMYHFDAVNSVGKIDAGKLEILEKKAVNG